MRSLSLIPASLLLAAPLSAQDLDWVAQFGGPDGRGLFGLLDQGGGESFLASNVTGGIHGPPLGGIDLVLERRGDDGAVLWGVQLGSNEDELGTAMAASEGGGYLIAGNTTGSWGAPNQGRDDAFVAKVDAAGNTIFLQQFGGADIDLVRDVISDGAGGAYVCGYTYSALFGPNQGNRDCWLARFDATGALAWSKQIGGSNSDRFFALADDGAGGVFAIGETRSAFAGALGFGEDLLIARYSGGGFPILERGFGVIGDDSAFDAVPDGQGGLFVVGESSGGITGPVPAVSVGFVARFDPFANLTWITSFGEGSFTDAQAIARDDTGTLHVAGSTRGTLFGPSTSSLPSGWVAQVNEEGRVLHGLRVESSGFDVAGLLAPRTGGGAFVAGLATGVLVPGAVAGQDNAWLAALDGVRAERVCGPAVVNSTGLPARLDAIGSNVASKNQLTLIASRLPAQQFGMFIASMTEGLTPMVGGGAGTLCLGGTVGRFAPNVGYALANSGPDGTVEYGIDLTRIPQAGGLVQAIAGQRWTFQMWFRDFDQGVTSNLTDAVRVLLR